MNVMIDIYRKWILQRTSLVSGDFNQWRTVFKRQLKRFGPQLLVACAFILLVIGSFIKLNYYSWDANQMKTVQNGEEATKGLLPVYIDQCKCHKYIPTVPKSLNRRKKRDDVWSKYYKNHPQSFPEIPDNVDELIRLQHKYARAESYARSNGKSAIVPNEETKMFIQKILRSKPGCSNASLSRGLHQNVVAFTYFEGSVNESMSTDHYSRDYFGGIYDNLKSMEKWYPGFVMRVYYQLPKTSKRLQYLCQIACSEPMIDICDMESLPNIGNASSINPPIWRFLPGMDPMVDTLLVRDLDSTISSREAHAVKMFLESSKADFHVMRDHPQHNIEVPAGMWGVKLRKEHIRNLYEASFGKLLSSISSKRGYLLAFAPRARLNPDQIALKHLFWPWARKVAMAHDSYFCDSFDSSKKSRLMVPFPTKRQSGIGNYVGAVVELNNTIPFIEEYQCPKKCREKPDWDYC